MDLEAAHKRENLARTEEAVAQLQGGKKRKDRAEADAEYRARQSYPRFGHHRHGAEPTARGARGSTSGSTGGSGGGSGKRASDLDVAKKFRRQELARKLNK